MSDTNGESTGDDDIEGLCTTANEKHAKWLSCRRSSLLDDQEDDEEEVFPKEPDLMCLTDEESDESSEKSKEEKQYHPSPDAEIATGNNIDGQDMVEDIITDSEAAMESIAQLTEGVASYLCPSNFENSNPDKYPSRGRQSSETDFFQQHMSAGSCGTSAWCGQKVGLSNLKTNNSTMALEELAQQPVLRNRCAVRAAQTRRVQELWNNWHSSPGDSPNGASDTMGQSRLTPRNLNKGGPLPIVWSIGATKSLGSEMEVHTNSNFASMISPISHDAFAFSDMLMTTHDESANLLDVEEESDLFYDSDPECFGNTRISSSDKTELLQSRPALLRSRSRSEPAAKLSRRRMVPPPIDTALSSTNDIVPPLTPRHSGGDSKSTTESLMDIERFDMNDDGLILDFIKELTVGTVTLVWHPSPHEGSKVSSSPVSVQGWFEMGSLLSCKLIQPKFMWRSTYQPSLDRKKLSMSSTTPHSVELLSIVKILKPESIDRTVYPFAKLDQSFTLSCHSNKVYMFEAASSQERDRFVHGLKLVVARLASMIIVGDDDVFAEFFSPWGPSAPVNEASICRPGEVERNRAASRSEGGAVTGTNFLSTTDEQRRELWGTSFFS